MSGADAAAAPGAVSHPPVHCHHFSAGRCGSCTLMGTPYRVQLQRKDAAVPVSYTHLTLPTILLV